MKADIQTKQAEIEEKNRVILLNQHIEEEIKQHNSSLSQLSSFYQKNIYLVPVLKKINILLPSGIYLDNLGFNLVKGQNEEKTRRVSLSGLSSSREKLIEFKTNLEKESQFLNVSFSPASWVKPTDVNFSVMFTLQEN